MIFADYPGHFITIIVVIALASALTWTFMTTNLKRLGAKRILFALIAFLPLLALLIISWNPSNLTTTEQTQKCCVLVFFDTSRSMSIEDQDHQQTRLDSVIDIFNKKFFTKSKDKPEYRIFGFDKDTYSVNSAKHLLRWGQRSDLRDSWKAVCKELNSCTGEDTRNKEVSGAIIFTDGQADNQNLTFYEPLKNKDIPVMFVGVGSNEKQPDLKLISMSAPARVAVDTTYPVTAKLNTYGMMGSNVKVDIFQNDYLIDTKTITPSQSNSNHEFKFSLSSSAKGNDTITVKASTEAKELNIANNTMSKIIRVESDSRVKVLFYSQVANFNLGKIRQILLRDQKVDLDFKMDVVIDPLVIRDNPNANIHVKFPEDKTKLNSYDILLFGPTNFNMFSDNTLKNIYDFTTQRGGTMILLPGKDNFAMSRFKQPLISNLLPVTFTYADSIFDRGDIDIPVLQTSEAIAASVFSKEAFKSQIQTSLPAYSGMKKKPAATTLLTLAEEPFLCFHRIGRGRVCVINSDLLFQWYREDQQGGFLHQFFANLTSYLAQVTSTSSRIDIVARRDNKNNDIIVEAFVRGLDYEPISNATVLMDVNNELIKMSPASDGRYIGRLSDYSEQSFLMKVKAESSGVFLGEEVEVIDLPQKKNEMSEPRANKQFLEKLARHTGAKYINSSKVTQKDASIFRVERTITRTKEISSIWQKWSILIFICCLLTFNWFIRRTVGLV